MPARASKAKGRRLQNLLRDKLRTAMPGLEEDDIQSQTMGMTGEDIVLSPAARKKIPYSFECKNQEKLFLYLQEIMHPLMQLFPLSISLKGI